MTASLRWMKPVAWSLPATSALAFPVIDDGRSTTSCLCCATFSLRDFLPVASYGRRHCAPRAMETRMALTAESKRVAIRIDDNAEVEGTLWLPEDSLGLILFAHGGNSSRLKSPSDYVACVLREARLATLWMDLLTPAEARNPHVRADIALLAQRLGAACTWVRRCARTKELPLGVFGVKQGAAAALQLAAARGSGISAIVSRGGRAELAPRQHLSRVSAPTLLIVGSLDEPQVKANRAAYAALRCKKRFEIIPGATHSFEEPGNQEVIARLARSWFLQHAQSRQG
jgi:putative phosphoribosyl transferase